MEMYPHESGVYCKHCSHSKGAHYLDGTCDIDKECYEDGRGCCPCDCPGFEAEEES